MTGLPWQIPTLALALAACAAPATYMGIPLAPGAAPPELRLLALQAATGDKQAQLALGDAYAEGRLLPRDCARARTLWKQAARPSGGTVWIYRPPSGPGDRGGVMPVERGPRMEGLQAAGSRLQERCKGAT